MNVLTPFSSAASIEIKGSAESDLLTFETDQDRYTISGSIDLTPDKTSLAAIDTMIANLEKLRDHLRSRELPDKTVSGIPKGPEVDNPYA